MRSHEAKGQTKVIVSRHYGSSCLNAVSAGRGAHKKCCSVRRPVSLLTGINNAVTNYFISLCSTHLLRDSNPFICTSSMDKTYFCALFSFCPLLPASLCRRLVDRFPLTSLTQTTLCNGGKHWIRCYVNHNMHRLHRCCKLFVWSQQNISLFFFFLLNAKQGLSHRVETSLSPLHRAACTAKRKVWAELNSLSSFLCQWSKCISCGKK